MTDQRWRTTDWSLEGWVRYAWDIEHTPRSGAAITRRIQRHFALFPMGRVREEIDRDVLASARRLVKQGSGARFGRPNRGYRAGHPTTAILMAVNNQLARLGRDGSNSEERVDDV